MLGLISLRVTKLTGCNLTNQNKNTALEQQNKNRFAITPICFSAGFFAHWMILPTQPAPPELPLLFISIQFSRQLIPVARIKVEVSSHQPIRPLSFVRYLCPLPSTPLPPTSPAPPAPAFRRGLALYDSVYLSLPDGLSSACH